MIIQPQIPCNFGQMKRVLILDLIDVVTSDGAIQGVP